LGRRPENFTGIKNGRFSCCRNAITGTLKNARSSSKRLFLRPISRILASSRRFLNPLYLRIQEIPRAERLGPLLEKLAAAGRALGAVRRIDRESVFRLKQEAWEAIWAGFSGHKDFEDYCRRRRSENEPFATYCALAARFGGDFPPIGKRAQAPTERRTLADTSDGWRCPLSTSHISAVGKIVA
jgi:4-alpha-glucanotransferase